MSNEFNPITAMTGTLHVTSLDARKMIYAVGGPWPHRCIIGDDDFGCAINSENSLYFDLAPGVVVYHGYVFSCDEAVSFGVTAASSGKYKKATFYLECKYNGTSQLESMGYQIAYSSEGSSADSLSYPAPTVPADDSYIVDYSGAFNIPVAHILILGNVIQSVENLLPAWDNKQFYAPGDEIDLSYNIFSGYLAASGANVYFFIPFAKAMSNITGATLSGAFTIRHADGGFIGSNSGQSLDSLGTVTVTVYESGAYVRVVMGTASQLTNQAPLSVLAANGTKLTFN